MKILSFAVWVECPSCEGKRRVPGGQREYGETIDCARCSGRGRVIGETLFEDFATLIKGISRTRTP